LRQPRKRGPHRHSILRLNFSNFDFVWPERAVQTARARSV